MDTFLIYFFGVLTGVALSLLIFYITMVEDYEKEIKEDTETIEKIQKLIDYIDCMERKEANHD